MKKILVLVLFCIFSTKALCWSIDGHILMADLALESLSPAKVREFDRIARNLERTFDTDRRLYLLNVYGEASDFSTIAAFPDRVRDLTLTELFAQWDLQVPEPLADLAGSDTSAWHYKNQAYYSGEGEAPQCNLAAEVNIASVYPLLLQSYEQAQDDVSKAILLAFIMHFVADAHQPLHSISRVDLTCEQDFGGNSFCATERGFADRCNTSLHSLWDGGVGLFERYDTYETLKRGFVGKPADAELAEDLDINHWLRESYQEARFIYTLREDRVPDDIYVRDSQHIVYTRLALASARLAKILDDL